MDDDEQQYMRVPKENAEAVMGKLVDAGLIDEDAWMDAWMDGCIKLGFQKNKK